MSGGYTQQVPVEIDDVEIMLDVTYSYSPGAPEQGPSYASGGQPAEAAEIEITGMSVNGIENKKACPFCGRDPFHYVDNGVGMEAVAVTCCDLGIEFFARTPSDEISLPRDVFMEIGAKLLDLRREVPLWFFNAVIAGEGVHDWLQEHHDGDEDDGSDREYDRERDERMENDNAD